MGCIFVKYIIIYTEHENIDNSSEINSNSLSLSTLLPIPYLDEIISEKDNIYYKNNLIEINVNNLNTDNIYELYLIKKDLEYKKDIYDIFILEYTNNITN